MQYLAIDVGGTSTRVAVVDAHGTCIGYGAAGSGNPTSSGLDTAATAIASATRDALAAAGLTDADVAAGTVGIAGAGGETGVALLAELRAAGVSVPLTLEADLLAAFCAGTLSMHGYAIVSGTGACAVRIRDLRVDDTGDGLGWLLGDGGSGFWLGHRAVRVVAAALDDGAPVTRLVDLVLTDLGITHDPTVGTHGRSTALDQLVHTVYRLRPVELARLAPLVFEAAAAGDVEAVAIVRGAANALTSTLATVLDPEVAGPLVLCGSILARQPSVADPVAATFRSVMGADAAAIPVTDGLPGAAVLALRRAGLTVDDAVFERIHDTVASRR
jgi:N-acetylglucosamine kinase-like BadF-type ATPase